METNYWLFFLQPPRKVMKYEKQFFLSKQYWKLMHILNLFLKTIWVWHRLPKKKVFSVLVFLFFPLPHPRPVQNWRKFLGNFFWDFTKSRLLPAKKKKYFNKKNQLFWIPVVGQSFWGSFAAGIGSSLPSSLSYFFTIVWVSLILLT